MNVRRQRRFLPRWTIGTMLILVGWCSVVLWLNIRPRLAHVDFYPSHIWHNCPCDYGCPWTCAEGDYYYASAHSTVLSIFYHALAANVAVGLLAVIFLTLISSWLLRHIISLRKCSSVGEQ